MARQTTEERSASHQRTYVYRPLCSICRRESRYFTEENGKIYCTECGSPKTNAFRQELRARDEDYNLQLRKYMGIIPV